MNEEIARTVAVNIFVFGELFYLFDCRSLKYSMFKVGVFSNPYVWLGVIIMILLQLMFTYLPIMNRFFQSKPIGLKSWGIVLVISFVISAVIGVEKSIRCKLSVAKT